MNYYTSPPEGWDYDSNEYGSALWHDACLPDYADEPKSVTEDIVGMIYKPTSVPNGGIEIQLVYRETCECGAFFLWREHFGYSGDVVPEEFQPDWDWLRRTLAGAVT